MGVAYFLMELLLETDFESLVEWALTRTAGGGGGEGVGGGRVWIRVSLANPTENQTTVTNSLTTSNSHCTHRHTAHIKQYTH